MRRLLSLLLLLLLFSVLFVSCEPESEPETTPDPEIQMTEDYAAGRRAFKLLTGIDLPKISDAGVDPSLPEYGTYLAGLNAITDAYDEVEVFINHGSAFTFETYMMFENFFKETLGDCDVGYPSGDVAAGRRAIWTSGDAEYETSWAEDAGEYMIVISFSEVAH